jgi:hypothetical protein
MNELTTFINNTDCEHEFSRIGKIRNVSCVSCGSLVPESTPQLHIETSSQNTRPSKKQLINGRWGGGREGEREEQDFVDHSFSQCRSIREHNQLWQDENCKHTSARKLVSGLSRNYSWYSSSGEFYGCYRRANHSCAKAGRQQVLSW